MFCLKSLKSIKADWINFALIIPTSDGLLYFVAELDLIRLGSLRRLGEIRIFRLTSANRIQQRTFGENQG